MVHLSPVCSEEDRSNHSSLCHIRENAGQPPVPVETIGVAPPAKRAAYVIGPNGDVVTIADLPSAKYTRWVIRRKAEVVLAVHAGLISLEEACRRYRLTVEEFFSWQSAIERHGLSGLRTTQLQHYRYGDKEPGRIVRDV